MNDSCESFEKDIKEINSSKFTSVVQQDDCTFTNIIQHPSIQSYVELLLLGLLIVFLFIRSISHPNKDHS